LLLLPVIMLIQLLLTQAAVTLLATLDVFYRDVQELVTYAITVMFFLTPIFYLPKIVPARWSPMVSYNPLAAIMNGYHDILYSGTMPSFSHLGYALGVAIVGLLVANASFERYRESFSQYL
jgi:lipopolysaccharide transport system permease protein